MKLNDLPKIDAALAPQAISTDVLLEKYAKGTESSAEDIHHRVSIALAAVEQPAEQDTGRPGSSPPWPAASSPPAASTRPVAPTSGPR
jgi:hypothetical protein